MNLAVALAATLFERLFGYPVFAMQTFSHPVIWMGKAIEWAEGRFNRQEWPAARRRLSGILVMAGLGALTLAIAAVVSMLLRWFALGWLVEAGLASSLIASRHLGRSVCDVALGLEGSLTQGRNAVSKIVGRDTAGLDEDGVVRGALESLAENTSDGVVAPILFLALFGLPGIMLYKLFNTADSMIGHKNDRYCDFGWAAARLDDWLNIVPARLTAMLFAAACLPQTIAARRAWTAARRDAPRHRSPNAGWPEAAMAGALGLALGGPRDYSGKTNDLAFMGDGRKTLITADIAPALALYRRALNLMTLVLVVAAAISILLWNWPIIL